MPPKKKRKADSRRLEADKSKTDDTKSSKSKEDTKQDSSSEAEIIFERIVPAGRRSSSSSSSSSEAPCSSPSREQEILVTITFQPGDIGIQTDSDDFRTVRQLKDGGQAKRLGVKLGWKVQAVGDQRCDSFRDDLLVKAVAGSKEFQITFEKVDGVWLCATCETVNDPDYLVCKGCLMQRVSCARGWACPHCGFENEDYSMECVACSFSRPANDEWKCHQCTLLNQKAALACIACDYVKRDADIAMQQPRSSASETPEVGDRTATSSSSSATCITIGRIAEESAWQKKRSSSSSPKLMTSARTASEKAPRMTNTSSSSRKSQIGTNAPEQQASPEKDETTPRPAEKLTEAPRNLLFRQDQRDRRKITQELEMKEVERRRREAETKLQSPLQKQAKVQVEARAPTKVLGRPAPTKGKCSSTSTSWEDDETLASLAKRHQDKAQFEEANKKAELLRKQVAREEKKAKQAADRLKLVEKQAVVDEALPVSKRAKAERLHVQGLVAQITSAQKNAEEKADAKKKAEEEQVAAETLRKARYEEEKAFLAQKVAEGKAAAETKTDDDKLVIDQAKKAVEENVVAKKAAEEQVAAETLRKANKDEDLEEQAAAEKKVEEGKVAADLAIKTAEDNSKAEVAQIIAKNNMVAKKKADEEHVAAETKANDDKEKADLAKKIADEKAVLNLRKTVEDEERVEVAKKAAEDKAAAEKKLEDARLTTHLAKENAEVAKKASEEQAAAETKATDDKGKADLAKKIADEKDVLTLRKAVEDEERVEVAKKAAEDKAAAEKKMEDARLATHRAKEDAEIPKKASEEQVAVHTLTQNRKDEERADVAKKALEEHAVAETENAEDKVAAYLAMKNSAAYSVYMKNAADKSKAEAAHKVAEEKAIAKKKAEEEQVAAASNANEDKEKTDFGKKTTEAKTVLIVRKAKEDEEMPYVAKKVTEDKAVVEKNIEEGEVAVDLARKAVDDKATNEVAQKASEDKEADPLVPCLSRVPVVGDKVRKLDDDSHGHTATVVFVDADGDFKLCDENGIESEVTFRKDWGYVQDGEERRVSLSGQSWTKRDQAATINGTWSVRGYWQNPPLECVYALEAKDDQRVIGRGRSLREDWKTHVHGRLQGNNFRWEEWVEVKNDQKQWVETEWRKLATFECTIMQGAKITRLKPTTRMIGGFGYAFNAAGGISGQRLHFDGLKVDALPVATSAASPPPLPPPPPPPAPVAHPVDKMQALKERMMQQLQENRVAAVKRSQKDVNKILQTVKVTLASTACEALLGAEAQEVSPTSEAARKAEEERLAAEAEAARQIEEDMREAETARKSEEEEAARKADEEKQAEEARIAEERQKAEEESVSDSQLSSAKRLLVRRPKAKAAPKENARDAADEEQCRDDAELAIRLAQFEEVRLRREAARKADEEARMKAAAEKKAVEENAAAEVARKAAEEKAAAERKAAEERAAIEKKVAEEKAAAEKKAAEEKAVVEAAKKAAAEKKAAEDKAAAEKKAADEAAAEAAKKAAERAAAEKKAAEDKAAAEKKASEEKAAAEAANTAVEKVAAEKKAAEEKASAEKMAAEKKADEEAAAEEEEDLQRRLDALLIGLEQADVIVQLASGKVLHVTCGEGDTILLLRDKLQSLERSPEGTSYRIMRGTAFMMDTDNVLEHGKEFQAVVMQDRGDKDSPWSEVFERLSGNPSIELQSACINLLDGQALHCPSDLEGIEIEDFEEGILCSASEQQRELLLKLFNELGEAFESAENNKVSSRSEHDSEAEQTKKVQLVARSEGRRKRSPSRRRRSSRRSRQRSRRRRQRSSSRRRDNRRCSRSRPREKTVEVNLKQVRFTHSNISTKFREGASFEDLVQDLASKKVKPLEDAFLTLDCVKVASADTYHSLFNRRLYCLQKYHQEYFKPEEEMLVKVKVIGTFESKKVMDKFVSASTSQDGGESVALRRTHAYLPAVRRRFGAPTSSSRGKGRGKSAKLKADVLRTARSMSKIREHHITSRKR